MFMLVLENLSILHFEENLSMVMVMGKKCVAVTRGDDLRYLWLG
jgi:hypothetical protein